MRHKKQNNIHSTSNHNNAQHQKYPTQPVPQKAKTSILAKIAGRFKEKPATPEEVRQLGLNAKRETYKTQIAKAKQARPSRLGMFGGSEPAPRYRQTSKYNQEESFLFGGNKGGGGFLDMGSGPSLDFITGGGGKKPKGYKSGLEEMF